MGIKKGSNDIDYPVSEVQDNDIGQLMKIREVSTFSDAVCSHFFPLYASCCVE